MVLPQDPLLAKADLLVDAQGARIELVNVQLDPVHKLFLVGQPISSTAPGASSVHVFNEQGQLVKSINGLKLPSGSALLALSPAARRCFVVNAPDLNELQSFTY